MAQLTLRFHPEAALEYVHAYRWYAARSPAAAARFEGEVERVLHLASRAPGRWPRWDARHRRLLLRRFPYALIYRVRGEDLWVVALAHDRRRPGFWRSREAEA